MNTIQQKMTNFFLAFTLALGCGTSIADDTEIYFGGGQSSVRPNLLIMLDTSGSMGNRANDDPQGRTRLQVMKDALDDLLSNITNVNVGLMRFSSINSNTGDKGGAVIYPIADLDAFNCTIVSEPDDGACTVSAGPPGSTSAIYSLSGGDDDAVQEMTGNTVDLAGAALQLGRITIGDSVGGNTYDAFVGANLNDEYSWDGGSNSSGRFRLRSDNEPASGATAYVSGLRFTGLNLPNDATINDARVYLTPNPSETEGNETGQLSTEVYAHEVGNADDFGNAANDLRTRPLTTAFVPWPNVGADMDVETSSPNLAPLFTELFADVGAGWTVASPLVLIFKNNTSTVGATRNFYSHEQDSKRAGRLVVDYSIVATSTADHKVALRFPQIAIPRGSTINSAKLEFTASATDASAAQWVIAAEDTGEPAVYANAVNDIGSRSTTTATYPATGTYAVPAWTSGTVYETPDLSAIVSEVVGKSDWCGGAEDNALSFIISGTNALRLAHSFESGSGAPRLHVTYTPNENGCVAQQLVRQPDEAYADAEERPSDGDMNRTSVDLDIGYRYSGVRFDDLYIPKNATISSASLELTCRGDCNDSLGNITVKGFLDDDMGIFSSTDDDITDRTTTSASVTYAPGGTWSTNQTISTNDLTPTVSTESLKDIIQEIVNQTDWASGNALGVRIKAASGNREIYSWDGDPSKAVRLRVSYEGTLSSSGGATGSKLVRKRMRELVGEVDDGGYTPLVETLYEAARYWRGEDIRYGDDRNGLRSNRVSHPATYCDDNAGNCNGADTTNHPNYGQDRSASCTYANLNSSDCASEEIAGTPTYISPFENSLSCSTHYQIMLTDGEANALSSTSINSIQSTYFGGTACDTTRPSGDSVGSAEKCGQDIAEFLHTVDQSTGTNGLVDDQNVTTYTIGLDFCPDGKKAAIKASDWATGAGTVTCCNTASIIEAEQGLGECPNGSSTTSPPNALQFLDAVATKGGGFFDEAKNTNDLINTFQDIVTEVLETPTSFAAPAITTNFFNRTRSREQIYFGLFTPTTDKGWPGNIKRFRVCVDTTTKDPVTGEACSQAELTNTTILDQNDNDAVDTATLLFKDTSSSYWSKDPITSNPSSANPGGANNLADGNATQMGGAGSHIADDASPTMPNATNSYVLDYSERIILTDEGSSGLPASGTNLYTTAGHKLTTANDGWGEAMQHVRDVVCPADGDPAGTTQEQTDNADCNNRMLWMLGEDILDENSDTDLFPAGHPRAGQDTRWSYADVIHASPVVVTYGFEDINPHDTDTNAVDQTDEPNDTLDGDDILIDKLLSATNDGGMRMINPLTGVEDWIFMPDATLQNQQALYGGGTGDHVYGLDSTPIVRYIDNNNDGRIVPTGTAPNGADKVYAYFGMRRGGSSIYALDITPACEIDDADGSCAFIQPKLLWRIDGGSGGTAGFERMGQSWSKPEVATIKVRESDNAAPVDKDVLVFTGGFDPALDGTDVNGAYGMQGGQPNKGNAIYIVDADNGQLLFVASHKGNGVDYTDAKGILDADGTLDTTNTLSVGNPSAHIVHPDMVHSIAGDVNIIDWDGNGTADRLYVGDTGGQVWRLDFGDDIMDDGTILSTSTHPTNGVSQRTVLGKLASISDAATTVNQRRFFAKLDVALVRDPLYGPQDKYSYVVGSTGYRAHPLNTAVQDRFYAFRDLQVGHLPGSASNPYIADTALWPVINHTTANMLIDLTSADELDPDTDINHKNSRGWFFDFPDNGEKGLTPAVIVGGNIFFSTYSPTVAAQGACSANIGTSFAYRVNLQTGAGEYAPSVSDTRNRRFQLGAGLASDPLPLFTVEGVKIVAGLQQSLQDLSGNLDNTIQRTYWFEQSR